MSPSRSNVSVRKQKNRKKEEQRENQQLASQWKSLQQNEEEASGEAEAGSQTQESSQEQAKAVESANTFRTNRQATTRFLANSQYFTIAIYVIAVVAIAAVIFKAIISLDQTITWIKNVLNVLMPFIIGFLIAFILNPAVKMFCRLLQKHTKIRKKGVIKGIAIAITYIILLGLVLVSVFGVVPQIVNSLQTSSTPLSRSFRSPRRNLTSS